MRAVILIVLTLLASVNQDGYTPPPGDPTIYDDLDRQPPGVFAEAEVLSQREWRYDDPRGVNSRRGWLYQFRIGRAMRQTRFGSEFPTTPGVEREFLLISHIRDVPNGGRSGAFDDRPGRAQLTVGRRVIFFAEEYRIQPATQFWIMRAWRIDTATDTVAEACVGYPAGTPIAQVLAPRSPAPADAGTPDAPTTSDAPGD